MPCIYIKFLTRYYMKGMIHTLGNFLLLSMLEALVQIGFHMLGVVSVTALPFRDLSTIHLLNFIYKFHSLGTQHTLFCTLSCLFAYLHMLVQKFYYCRTPIFKWSEGVVTSILPRMPHVIFYLSKLFASTASNCFSTLASHNVASLYV
jgi:hypothetical protein